MSDHISAWTVGNRIYVKSPYVLRFKMKSITGGRWDSTKRAWHYPRSHRTLNEILKTLPGPVALSEDLLTMLEEGDPYEQAAEIREATDLPNPPVCKGNDWLHQRRAYWWAKDLPAILLDMWMGSGKTRTAINIIQNWYPEGNAKILVACPPNVVPVWEEQIATHSAIPCEVTLLPAGKSTAKRTEIAEQAVQQVRPGVITCLVCNYEGVWRGKLGEWVLSQQWDAVVADECVVKGTKIAAPAGKYSVEIINKGDCVWGWDEQKQEIVSATVTHTFSRTTQEPLYAISHTIQEPDYVRDFTPRDLVCTGNHPVWTPEGYVKAEDLKAIEHVRVFLQDDEAPIRCIRGIRHVEVRKVQGRNQKVKVYNIETTTGNYFADGILVHNCHHLKAPGSKQSLFFAKLHKKAKRRLGLTGTPLHDGPLDIYGQARFLVPEVFGTSFANFRSRYARMGGYGGYQVLGYQNLEEFYEKYRSFTYTVGPDEALPDLPPILFERRTCSLNRDEMRVYSSLEHDLMAQVKDGTVSVNNALTKLIKLQQVTSGYVRDDDGTDHFVGDSKKKLLADVLSDLPKDEPVVVFCRFTHDLQAVHEVAKADGRQSFELSGARKELQEWTRSEGGAVIAVQLRSGGEGIPMYKSRYVVDYSLSFSLGEYNQTRSRLQRPEQRRQVISIALVAEGTVDEQIYRALKRKENVVKSIMEDYKGGITK